MRAAYVLGARPLVLGALAVLARRQVMRAATAAAAAAEHPHQHTRAISIIITEGAQRARAIAVIIRAHHLRQQEVWARPPHITDRITAHARAHEATLPFIINLRVLLMVRLEAEPRRIISKRPLLLVLGLVLAHRTSRSLIIAHIDS